MTFDVSILKLGKIEYLKYRLIVKNQLYKNDKLNI